MVDHTHGAQDALRHMLRDPGHALRGSLARLSPDDRDLLVANVHDLMQIVAVWVFDVTARDNENTPEDRMTLAKARTQEVNPIAAASPHATSACRDCCMSWPSVAATAPTPGS